MKEKVKDKVTSTDRYKEFEQSEEFEKIQKFRKEVQEFRGDVKEQAEQSQNPMTQRVLAAKDTLSNDSSTGRAIREM